MRATKVGVDCLLLRLTVLPNNNQTCVVDNAKMRRRSEPRLLGPTTGSQPALLSRLWSDPDSRRYLVMLSLTGSYCLTEIVTGVYLDSLALQSDAMHMLSDALALVVGLIATVVARSQTGAASARIDAVGALVNGVFLLSTCLHLGLDASARVFAEADSSLADSTLAKETDLLMIVAGLGLLVDLLSL